MQLKKKQTQNMVMYIYRWRQHAYVHKRGGQT